MSSISSISVGANTYAPAPRPRLTSSQASQMASDLFAKLDSRQKGFLSLSDFTTAVSAASNAASPSPTVSSTQAIFSQLDQDSDGKVTESEFNLTVSTLVNQLADEGHRLAVQGGADMTTSAPPPPPSDVPPSNTADPSSGDAETPLAKLLSGEAGGDRALKAQIGQLMRTYGIEPSNVDLGANTTAVALTA